MSMGAVMSIMGLYNNDNTVFDLMQFPDGFTEAQKETVTDNILIECAELEILYPNPTVMKNIIGIWSKKELPYWQRIYDASLLEYNPIENYRRTETETIEDGRTEEHSGNDVSRASGSDSNTASGSDTNTGNSNSTDTESGSDTTTNKVSGYDSNTLVDNSSSEIDYGHVNTNYASGSNTQSYGRVDTQQYGRTDTVTHGEKIEHTGESERSVLAFGNIGVTTSQQMLTQEIEIAKIINVIPVIIDSFKNRFCLTIY